MKIKKLSLKGYRNIKNMEIFPSEGINIIYGDNAQGKTNLLEGIWLFTGCKSFRGTKDTELVGFNQSFARLDMDFNAFDRDQNASIVIESNRRASLNGVQLSSAARMMGEFLAVVFSPAHLSLVQAGPSQRRRFLDTALSQVSRRYAAALTEYNKVLLQRNYLLKDIPRHSELLDTLDIWDFQLAGAAKVILEERISYTDKIKQIAKEIYGGLSSSTEEMSMSYQRKVPEGLPADSEPSLLLKQTRREDILSGSTNYGIHRDDLQIEINALSAREFGSQGQQRSSALALKLAEARIVKDFTGEQPIALLDDVMSELDPSRQDYILNHIQGWQVFITCCDPSAKLRMYKGSSFEVQKGNVVDNNK